MHKSSISGWWHEFR